MNNLKKFVVAVFAFATIACAEMSVEIPLPSTISDSLPWFAVREVRESQQPFTRNHLFSMAQNKERVALVYFATWCDPCMEGALKLGKYQKELAKHGVDVVLVNIGEKDEKLILSWVKKMGVSKFLVVGDPFKRMTEGFGMMKIGSDISLPRTLVVDKNGKPLFMLGQEGSDWPMVLWEKK